MKFDDIDDEVGASRFSRENLKTEVESENPILTDPVKAVDLVGRVIGQHWVEDDPSNSNSSAVWMLRRLWLSNLQAIESIELSGHIDFYREAMSLCDKMRDYSLVSLLHGKTILGIGGQFSAGKSAFINAVVGLERLLPEEQSPTTSIPTFVTKGDETRYLLTSMKGRLSQEISVSEINALSHSFHDKYGISFSAFIDSCIISSPDFHISPRIVLLDTPGYSKPDDLERSFTLSDRERALEQLKRADRLIWLIHQENGSISDDDIKFINDIHPDQPILIVVTHADQAGDANMDSIIGSIRELSSSLPCGVFGITGYSSPHASEYKGRHVIQDFLDEVERSANSKGDVIQQFVSLEDRIEESLRAAESEESLRVKELKKYIANTKEILAMRSLAILMEQSSVRLRLIKDAIKKQPDARAERRDLVKRIIGAVR